MSFGYVVLGFNSHPSRGEAAPSNVLIQDAAGNDNKFTTTIGGSATNDNDFQAPFAVQAGQAITFGFYSQHTGNVNTYAWSILNINDPEGLVASYSVSPSSGVIDGGAGINWNDLVITIAGSINPGAQAEHQVRLSTQNSGGTTIKNYTLIIAAQ